MGIQEGEERRKLNEIITETFRNQGKELLIQLHEANGSPNYFNTERTSPRYIKLVKSQ